MNRAPRWRWVLASVAASLAATQLVGPTAHAGEGFAPEAPSPALPGHHSMHAAAGTPSLPHGNEVLQTNEEALAQDLALVADAQGWTTAQAAAHHRSAEAVGAVAEQLAATRPDVFVGSALPTDPEGAPILYVKGVADPGVLALAATSPISVVVADGQPFSFDELEERKLIVHHALEAMGFLDIATGFELDGAGVITSAVTALPGLPRDPAIVTTALPASMRDSVRLTVHDEDVVVDDHAFGGMRVSSATGGLCTSGWSVYHPNGTTGVTTAGHCNGINSITEPGVGNHTLTHQQEHRGQWGDIEWKTSAHSEPAQFYATATEIRRTNFLEARGNISVNESVCLYGRSSNNRHCSTVSDVSEACTNSGVFNDRLVLTNHDVGIGGDSGGGWSFDRRAYGSQKGSCSGRDAFSVADLYDEALGVRVRLSDTMTTNVTLHEEDRLVSTDGRFTAIMQNDGNFVVYQAGVGAIWASGTNGNWGARLVMQGDGNLVIYRTNGTAAWATMTFGSGHVLVMQNDGNLVMYGAGARWASNTCCR